MKILYLLFESIRNLLFLGYSSIPKRLCSSPIIRLLRPERAHDNHEQNNCIGTYIPAKQSRPTVRPAISPTLVFSYEAPPVVVTVVEVIGRPPKVPAEASPLEREVAAEAIEGGVPSKFRIADPEVIDVIVMSST